MLYIMSSPPFALNFLNTYLSLFSKKNATLCREKVGGTGILMMVGLRLKCLAVSAAL